MATKSPPSGVKSREVIGGEQFSRRREVFEKHDSVFLPSAASSFKRNAAGSSSMRDTRSDERPLLEFRPRKYSADCPSDAAALRAGPAERTRRLSKLRRDFLNSNLHEPGARASAPAPARLPDYNIGSPKLHKFPFAEPYTTPTLARREGRLRSSPAESGSPVPDRQKLFEELVKRYSPQRKPVDWTLPPTRPKVVGSIPKSTSSEPGGVADADAADGDEVFEDKVDDVPPEAAQNRDAEVNRPVEVPPGAPEEAAEKNDYAPEPAEPRRPDVVLDLNIPALIDKMTKEGQKIEHRNSNGKKVKRKRSFLDKLLGRNKGGQRDQ